jgi:hypothetical protein|tara:strand:+ start:416 stop:694 length:279 start_codon:yes stop_codon:yes gene_type:complete
MILEILLVVSGLLVVILGYTTFNLLTKNEQAEDIIVSQRDFIDKINEYISYSEKRIEELDEKKVWRDDEEIGWFFNEIKKIKQNLSNFKSNS